jgi:hypothetical protein
MTVPAPVRWAQRKDKVLVTVGVIDVHDPLLKIEGSNFTFTGTAGQTSYASNVELFNEIDASQSQYVVRPRGIEIALVKKDASVWWPRLVKSTGKCHWLAVDWNRWVDSSDDEPSKSDFNWGAGDAKGLGGSDSDDEALAGDDAAPAGEDEAPAGDDAAPAEAGDAAGEVGRAPEAASEAAASSE